MARPIKETPILTGSDAEAFMMRMQNVESLSSVTRAENRSKLMNDFNAISHHISICI